jgi:hypothetical protein
MTTLLTRLEKLAGEVAINAPLNQNKWSSEARIPWSLVWDIRDELERLGINWKELTTRLRIP